MGAYIYKVLSKRVKCSDGKEANLAVFAYKPFGSMFYRKENSKMHFRSGAAKADRMAEDGKFSGRVVMAHKESNGTYILSKTIYEFGGGSFIDDVLSNRVDLYGVKDVNPVIEVMK